ncbi:MAG TPA: hypothetical protein PKO25_04850 [Spirochaetota bacterium]|nr:hypothetical protein [Spirochaetota bacterium]OPZ37872.1 MAG: hypothetical protein BWY96_01457 [Spirochaetes bacterium ADurb.BinA120]HNU91178.1 hypothetical protein [Spirochaetota bacterium]HPI14602.1 hypothetical protein [Spirochaetota bacterium]HPO44886.1 hypothetical protein [Spirochaetota bacterium]
MKCDEAMRRLLEHDNAPGYPLPLRLHLRRCAHCRAEEARLRAALEELKAVALSPRDMDISDAVMAGIERLESYRRDVPMYNWIGGGLAILGGIVLISFSDSFAWLRGSFGGDFEVPLSIVLGIVITLYASAFIATHLDMAESWMAKRRG